MMAQANIPVRFWVEAFSSVVFVINRLQSTVLNLDNLLSVLFKKDPDHGMLRVFGVQCFPCLRSYAKNKMKPRSLACIFLGYNDVHKSYRCYYMATKRMYMSRHVIFNEEVFPLQPSQAQPTVSSLDSSYFQRWFADTTDSNPPSQPQNTSASPYFPQDDTVENTECYTPIVPNLAADNVPVSDNGLVPHHKYSLLFCTCPKYIFLETENTLMEPELTELQYLGKRCTSGYGVGAANNDGAANNGDGGAANSGSGAGLQSAGLRKEEE
ncbi:hypothetical protein NE237_018085 [Protea cynaroides]|uniref:Retroviral polymerase SH3-like domain-containing protein n=1 Tax=Protea cynaroides TaxID=273540 RepID=A0A9Q0K982_9MAGN|nr:hypothetical protein NE237_018085 [Protea cynaroides]